VVPVAGMVHLAAEVGLARRAEGEQFLLDEVLIGS
jgi:hypothetical protein